MATDPELQVEALPVLPSLDIDETVTFYGGKLGFDCTVYREENYLIARRDDAYGRIELHFWLTSDRNLCENSSVYLRGGGIIDMHREFKERGIARMTDPVVRPWGMEEFYIHDPHGNLLRFGRNARQHPAAQ